MLMPTIRFSPRPRLEEESRLMGARLLCSMSNWAIMPMKQISCSWGRVRSAWLKCSASDIRVKRKHYPAGTADVWGVTGSGTTRCAELGGSFDETGQNFFFYVPVQYGTG